MWKWLAAALVTLASLTAIATAQDNSLMLWTPNPKGPGVSADLSTGCVLIWVQQQNEVSSVWEPVKLPGCYAWIRVDGFELE